MPLLLLHNPLCAAPGSSVNVFPCWPWSVGHLFHPSAFLKVQKGKVIHKDVNLRVPEWTFPMDIVFSLLSLFFQPCCVVSMAEI